MTAKIIRYSLYTLALLVFLLYTNGVKNAWKDSDSSITTELPAKETKEVLPPKTAPLSNSQTLTVQPFIPTFISNALANKKDVPVITLGKKNTLIFRDIVTQTSVGKLEQDLIAMSHSLPASTPIYLVLETPGGDIEAGLQLIDTVKALPQEVKTITQFAASMGFHIVENLGERLITPSGTLMSHRASIEGLAGRVPGEAVVRLNKILTQVNEMDKQVSKRVGMNYNNYQALVHDEYWVSGIDAVQDHMADKVVLIACAADLNNTYQQSIPTLFGTVSVTWSTCPAIGSPLSNNTGDILSRIPQLDQRQAMFNFLNSLFNNKEEFIKNYMIDSSYRKFIY